MATHQQVARAWAHKRTRNAYGYAMNHNGTVIYSWGSHFPIARHVRTGAGNPAILFTTRGYSVSTSKHIAITRRELPKGVRVFNVDNVMAETPEEHLENYRAMLDTAAEGRSNAARRRLDKYREFDLAQADEARHMANDYNVAFGLGRHFIVGGDK